MLTARKSVQSVMGTASPPGFLGGNAPPARAPVQSVKTAVLLGNNSGRIVMVHSGQPAGGLGSIPNFPIKSSFCLRAIFL